jgi:hypothetical protein
MNGRRQRAQSVHQGGCRSIEEFIVDTVNTALFRRSHLTPAAIANDLFQWNAIARAAPCRDQDIWILGLHLGKR